MTKGVKMLHSIFSLARYIKVSATSYALGICAAHKKNIKKKGYGLGKGIRFILPT